jgi:hypothetical protein
MTYTKLTTGCHQENYRYYNERRTRIDLPEMGWIGLVEPRRNNNSLENYDTPPPPPLLILT